MQLIFNAAMPVSLQFAEQGPDRQTSVWQALVNTRLVV